MEEVAHQLGYELLPKQREILSSPKSIVVVQAGRRAGKSWLASLVATATLLKCPGSVVMIIAPSRAQAADNIFARVIDQLDELLPRYGMDWVIRDLYGMRGRLSNGSFLLAGSDHFDIDRFRGWPVDLAILDEATWINPETWSEVVRPALAERKGRAFLVSTPFANHWFTTIYDQVRAKMVREGTLQGLAGAELDRWVDENLDWAFFRFPSWENTKVFPGGINDPKIVQARRDALDPYVFLQEYAAIAVPPRERVYPEFRLDVHVRPCPFDPKKKVYLAVDPAPHNIYACVAIQDYGDIVVVIDEFAQRGVLTEEVIDALRSRPWWRNLVEIVMDPDAEETRRKWRQHPAIEVPVRTLIKPPVLARIELVRYWLRDPWYFNKALASARQAWMEKLGFTKPWEDLSPEEKMEVETYALGDIKVEDMREAARLYIDPRCVRTIDEFSRQQFRRPRRPEANLPMQPQDALNDCTDALGYWFWVHKRASYAQFATQPPEEREITPGEWYRRYFFGEAIARRSAAWSQG